MDPRPIPDGAEVVLGFDGSYRDGTLARLKACRRELLEPLVTEHHGRIINFPGDNALCEFASVVDALECAVTIQRGVAERERRAAGPSGSISGSGSISADILAEERGRLRRRGENAARLEQLCEPGGVAVSGTAYDYLRGRLDRELEICLRTSPEEHRASGPGLPCDSGRTVAPTPPGRAPRSR